MANRRGGHRGGRPPKPLGVLLTGGTFRPDRHGDRDTAKETVRAAKAGPIPTAPSWLPPAARQLWARVAKKLHTRGHLALLDRESLAGLCQAWADAKRSEAAIAANLAAWSPVFERGAPPEPTSPTSDQLAVYLAALDRHLCAVQIVAAEGAQIRKVDGNIATHPAVQAGANAWKRVRDFAGEFGMTPSALTRLMGGNGKPDATSDSVPQELRDRATPGAGA